MTEIKEKDLQNLEKKYSQNDKARVVRNALTSNDISTISNVLEAQEANPRYFSIDLAKLPVTNQMASGRCWIFSALNVMRETIGKKFDIKEFELSQNFVAFYDKLEKANWFMECVLQEIDNPVGSPENRFLLDWAVGDGGQWNMLASLIKKYGICPKTAMPETYQSSHTRTMNGILNQRLRRFAADARKASAEGRKGDIAGLKKEALKEIYGLIASCFGLPPKSFTFEYYDKDEKHHAEYNITPLEFYEKYLGTDVDDYVSVINGPTADKPYHKLYTVKYLGNVVAGNRVELLNLPIEEFKEATLKQLKDGEVVWFGCDCGKDGDRESGFWDDGLFDYEGTLDMHLELTKAEQLDMRHSAMNHAMVITGVNLVDDKPTRWKIENSWSDKNGQKGYYSASDSWFDKYMYVVAINKKYLSEKALAALEEEPTVLEPWDPFGTLAD